MVPMTTVSIMLSVRIRYANETFFTVLQEIRKGADVTRADHKGRTALHFAATRGDTNMGRDDVHRNWGDICYVLYLILRGTFVQL